MNDWRGTSKGWISRQSFRLITDSLGDPPWPSDSTPVLPPSFFPFLRSSLSSSFSSVLSLSLKKFCSLSLSFVSFFLIRRPLTKRTGTYRRHQWSLCLDVKLSHEGSTLDSHGMSRRIRVMDRPTDREPTTRPRHLTTLLTTTGRSFARSLPFELRHTRLTR